MGMNNRTEYVPKKNKQNKTQTQTKPTTKQEKQRRRHAFARGKAVILQVVLAVQQQGSRRRKPRDHHAAAAAALSSGCEGQPGGSGRASLCTCHLFQEAYMRESLQKGKHLIMGPPGEGWIHSTCSSAFLHQGWALVVSICLLASAGRDSPRLVLSRPHGWFIEMDPLNWSREVRHSMQKMELNPTVLNLFHTGRSQRERDRHGHTHTHGHTQNPLLARPSQHLFPVW